VAAASISWRNGDGDGCRGGQEARGMGVGLGLTQEGTRMGEREKGGAAAMVAPF
jgi:hypothetical protein